MSSAARGRRTRRASRRHLRRLAEQHLDRHRDRRRAGQAVGHDELAVAGDLADHRKRAALARAQRREQLEPLGRDAQHVALLRLVAPQLERRQARLVGRDRAQLDAPAAARCARPPRARRSTVRRRRRRGSAGSGCRRRARRSARSLPARGAAFRGCRAAPTRSRGRRRSRRCRPTRRRRRRGRSASPGPPSTTSVAPGGTSAFSTWSRRTLPSPPAIMIGLW